MEKFELDHDIAILTVTAESFPAGVGAAFKKLEEKISNAKERDFFGISRPDRGTIVYKAGIAEARGGEAEKVGFDSFILTTGTYLVIRIPDWRGSEHKFGEAFSQLLQDPRLDLHFPCVEWYKGDTEVMCMVRIDPSK